MLVDWVQFAPPAPLTGGDEALLPLPRGRPAPPARSTWSSPTCAGPGSRSRSRAPTCATCSASGPILEGIGLNVTAWSYVDRMNFSFLGCPDLVDDLAPLVAELPRALEELRTTKGAACMKKPTTRSADPHACSPPLGWARAYGGRGRCPQGAATADRGPAARGADGRPARPRPHLRHRRARPDARRARRRAPARPGLHRPPRWALAMGELVADPPGDHARPALARSRDPLAAVPLHRLCRRRRRAAGRARRRAGDRRRLLDGRRDRAAGRGTSTPSGWPAWCCARPRATSAASSARSSSSRC